LFQNLIDNAAHYAGSAEIEMAQEPNRIIVTVQDRGPGLPNDMLTSALEPFVRNEPSRNRATGGVGLGLTIARSIAIDHGGAICLRARKGGGLCARVELPSFGSCA
jgi:signal transduction histidine kinase